jgi:hypothetical protein
LIPPFKGLIVSITGVSPTEARVRVQRKVEQGGGTFTPNMDNTCTHLVADVRHQASFFTFQLECSSHFHLAAACWNKIQWR